MRLELTEPSLIVLIGAAGAGKSTLAARLFVPDQILSSDAFRAVVSGDAADQRVTRTAFSILHRELARRLAARRTTIVDATNATASARRGLVQRATGSGVPAVAIVLALPPSLVLARNASRAGRVVPQPAVLRQLDDIDRSLRRGLEMEGFSAVYLLRTPAAVDALDIGWRLRA